MLSTLASVSALLLSYGVLCLGHSLNNTLLGLRATMEHYPDWVTGVMMSGYFLGYIIGIQICSRLIPKVGQIRIFAAFASFASAISLMHILYINPVSWIILRILYGMSISTLYMVIEGWLNSLSNLKTRGRIFSTYMVINFMGLSLGQGFFFVANPGSFQLFAVASVLISLALIPLTLSKNAKQPDNVSLETYSLKRLIQVSPLATLGCMATGLTTGAFWGMGAVCLSHIGLDAKGVATFIGCMLVGGLVCQWPIGYFSDLFNRRIAILCVCGLGAITALMIAVQFSGGEKVTTLSPQLLLLALTFGGFTYTLYSLCIALANDYLDATFIVKASGSLIMLHAMGAIAGPILVAMAMMLWGAHGFFAFFVVVNMLVVMLALRGMTLGRSLPEDTESFVAVPRSTVAIAAMDPRQDEGS